MFLFVSLLVFLLVFLLVLLLTSLLMFLIVLFACICIKGSSPVLTKTFVDPVPPTLLPVFCPVQNVAATPGLGEHRSDPELLASLDVSIQGLQAQGWRLVVVVAEDGLILVPVSSRGMREPCRNKVVESHRLETQWSLRVCLSDCPRKPVVEALQLQPLSHGGNDQSGVPPEVANEGLVDQLIGYYVWVALEGQGDFVPVGVELAVEQVGRTIQVVKCAANVVGEVVLTPVVLVAIFPVWES